MAKIKKKVDEETLVYRITRNDFDSEEEWDKFKADILIKRQKNKLSEWAREGLIKYWRNGLVNDELETKPEQDIEEVIRKVIREELAGKLIHGQVEDHSVHEEAEEKKELPKENVNKLLRLKG